MSVSESGKKRKEVNDKVIVNDIKKKQMKYQRVGCVYVRGRVGERKGKMTVKREEKQMN